MFPSGFWRGEILHLAVAPGQSGNFDGLSRYQLGKKILHHPGDLCFTGQDDPGLVAADTAQSRLEKLLHGYGTAEVCHHFFGCCPADVNRGHRIKYVGLNKGGTKGADPDAMDGRFGSQTGCQAHNRMLGG